MRSYGEGVDAAEKMMTASENRERHPIEATFERGFYDEERDAEHAWRWTSRRGRIVLLNPLDEARIVKVSFNLHTGGDRRQKVQIAVPGEVEDVEVTTKTPYGRTIELAASGRVELNLSCECERIIAPGDRREMYFGVSAFRIQ